MMTSDARLYATAHHLRWFPSASSPAPQTQPKNNNTTKPWKRPIKTLLQHLRDTTIRDSVESAFIRFGQFWANKMNLP